MAGERIIGSRSSDTWKAATDRGPLVYLSVEGRLDDVIKAVKQNGGTVLVEKEQIGPDGYRAVFLDSEGNRVALHSQKA